MSAPGRRLSRLFRRLLPGDLGAEVCDTLDRGHLERRARHGAAAAWLWHAAHLSHPQIWVLAVLLRRRSSGPRRGRSGLAFSWLDVKLGLRMMRRNPGLTVVAVFALSIGIPASLIPIHAMHAMVAPLPFDQGERIVGIRNRNVVERTVETRVLHDFFVWRDALSTFEAVGATRSGTYNVISDDGQTMPVSGAEVTASTFRILRVPPLMGRVLQASDELPGAPDVVVISYELWQTQLGGDPDVRGTTIDLGAEPHEIVGVMPESFHFPWRDGVWLPLRYRPTDFERGEGPALMVFGRLADGISIDDARAEVETVGRRLANEYPDTHGALRPQVLGYTEMAWGRFDGWDRTGTYLTELLALALLIIVCGNVGTLILARTVSRSGEIAVRTALGASRPRIVSQLFAEAFVLAVGATSVGLLLADVIATRFQRRLPFDSAFWLDFGVQPRTVGMALCVAALCAMIAGVLPALRVTGSRMGVHLQGVAARSGMRFGRASTFLIVAEVALTVALLTVGGTLTYALVEEGPPASAIEADEYLLVELSIPRNGPGATQPGTAAPESRERMASVVTELRDRLSSEPGVRGVAMGSRLPGMEHPAARVEVEGQAHSEGYRVRVATVDVDFLEGLGQNVLSGRGFSRADLARGPSEDPTAVLVNTAFVGHVLGERSPIGQRVRYVGPADEEPGPWYEIVGVVGHLGMDALTSRDEGIYHPAAPGQLSPIWMAIRLREDPLAFVTRLRRITGEIDPEALIQFPNLLSDAPNIDRTINLYSYLLLVFLCGVTLLLSGAGLYALMSFTVSQRTREIGIRTALGARPGRILAAIVRRTFLQLVGGIFAGVVVGLLLLYSLRGANIHGPDPALTLLACSAFMLLVGSLACLEPTLRGLRIEPAEALNEG